MVAVLCALALSAAGPVSFVATVRKGPQWSASIVRPVFTGLGTVGGVATRQEAVRAQAIWREFEPAVKLPVVGAGAPYSLDAKPTVSVANAKVVSLYWTIFASTGGAHPNTYLPTATYAMADGKPKAISLADLLLPGVARKDFVETILLPAVNEAKHKRGADPLAKLDPALADQFVVTPSGITWVFSPYDAGPYSEGSYFVRIPWATLESQVRNPLR